MLPEISSPLNFGRGSFLSRNEWGCWLKVVHTLTVDTKNFFLKFFLGYMLLNIIWGDVEDLYVKTYNVGFYLH